MVGAKTRRRVLLGLFSLAIVAYGAIVMWFSRHESDLLYFPEKALESSPEMFGMVYGKIQVPSTDSAQLVCWIIPSADTSTLWLLYLHGNAGNIAKTGYVEHYAQLHRLGLNILAVDYRSYGESSGHPSEQGLYDDARAAYGYLTSMQHVPPERIVVYGYSLGSAVAIDLVGRVPSAGLIVEGAFTSITDVGAELYPLIPVHWLAKSRFSSMEKISAITVPKLFLHARDDQTIPIRFGRRLFDMAREPKTFLEVKGNHESAHNVDAPLFYAGIRQFLLQTKSSTLISSGSGK